MNITIISGRLTEDPEIVTSKDGKMTYAKFSIAHQGPASKDGKKKTTYFTCYANGEKIKLIESLKAAGYGKGDGIFVTGKSVITEKLREDYKNAKGEGIKVRNHSIDVMAIDWGQKKRELPSQMESAPSPAADQTDFAQVRAAMENLSDEDIMI